MMDKITKDSYFSTDELRDGREARIRAIRHDDKPILQESWHHLSKQSQYFRFFAVKDDLTEQELEFLTDVDFVHHVGLLATVVGEHGEEPAGVGRYIMSNPAVGGALSAELAFVVVEEYQGLGIGTILLKHLIRIARAEGVAELTAFVLPENRRMLNILHNCGLPLREALNSAGVWEVSLSLT